MIKKKYLLIFILPFLISSCATILKGYNDKVSIINPPEDLKIQTNDGINIPYLCDSTIVIVLRGINKGKVERHVTKSKYYYIHLRSNQQHTLRFKAPNYEKTITVYPKMGAGWLILDTITGIIPIFFDMYTGCFNHFDDIHLDIE